MMNSSRTNVSFCENIFEFRCILTELRRIKVEKEMDGERGKISTCKKNNYLKKNNPDHDM